MKQLKKMSVLPGVLLLSIATCCSGYQTVIPTSQRQLVNTSAVITCHFSSCPVPSWRGPALTSSTADERVTVVPNGDRESVLTITNLEKEDDGQYYCDCDGEESVPSAVVVHHKPSLLGVPLNQTFQRNQTATILCSSDPGDPPHEPLWFYNDSMVDVQSTRRLWLDRGHQALVIRDIQESDAGAYVCGYQLGEGLISADITVTVTTPPEDMGYPPILLPSRFSVRYGDPLVLECGNDSSLEYAWVFQGEQLTENATLMLPPDQVSTGHYQCVIHTSDDNNQFQFSVFVILNTSPLLEEEAGEQIFVKALQRESLLIRLDFRFPLNLYANDFNIQVEEIKNGQREYAYLNFWHNISADILRFEIRFASLYDNGSYEFNISNTLGYTLLPVRLEVIPLVRTPIEVYLPDFSCDLVTYNSEAILSQILAAAECPWCGTVMRDVHHGISCSGPTGQDLTMISVRTVLLSQDILPEFDQVSLTIGDELVTAEVCLHDAPCPAVTEEPTDKIASGTLVAIIVPVAVTSCLILLAVGVLIFCAMKKKGQKGSNQDVELTEEVKTKD